MSYCSPPLVSDYNFTLIREYIQKSPQIQAMQGPSTMRKVSPPRAADRELGAGRSPTPSVTFFDLRDLGPLLGVRDPAAVSRDFQVGEIPPLVPGPYRIRLLDANALFWPISLRPNSRRRK
jgi:hypothetical protein